ncbi:MAG: IS256 family transposase [Planctomycetota bacterium]|nr:IS256 family transposase [Planctomycetota bacterium]
MRSLVELAIEHGTEAMAAAFTTLMNHAMQIEREQVLKAESHQRTADRQGYANGFKPKTMNTRVGQLELRVPQTRGYRDENGRPFYPKALDRGVRSERAMILAMAEMYVQGVSTRKVTAVVEELCGLEVTSTQVSRAAAELDEQLDAWRNRPIGEITYLVLDARYEKIRHNGAVRSCALLTAIGIGTDGKRSVLGCSVQLSEAEPHWRKFLESLLKRGMHGVRLVVSDDHSGLRAARQATLAGVPWQRCQFHAIQNAMKHVPKVAMRPEVARDLRRVFDADEPAEAERRLKEVVARYQKTAPQLAAWLEHAIPEALTVLTIPAAHRRRLRTTNSLERLNREIKRRTRVATLFPNEASLLRLASAVLSEISDDWETERAYLNIEAR